MENSLNALGRRIQVLRESNMMTRADLAQYIGVTRRDIVDWEEGRVIPTAQQVVDIAKLFSAEPRSLLDAEELPQTGDTSEPQSPAGPKAGKRLLAGVVCLALGICAAFGAAYLMQTLSTGEGSVSVSASAQVEHTAPLPDSLSLTAVAIAQWDLDGDGEKELVNGAGADVLFIAGTAEGSTAYALAEPLAQGQTLTAQDGVFIVKNEQGESRIYSVFRDGALYPAG